MLSYVATCARGGLEAVAFGAPTGPFGHIYRRTDAAQPYFDALGQDAVYPSFHLMAGLAPSSGKPVLKTELSAGGAIDALAVRDGQKTVLWIANLTKDTQTVTLPDGTRSVAVLDEAAFDRVAIDPMGLLRDLVEPISTPTLALGAYAVACGEIG